MDFEILKKLIANPNIKIISFDVFDTLLCRPSNHPFDLFYLISKKFFNLPFDFFKVRSIAEKECIKEKFSDYPSINDIYEYIKLRYKISEDLIRNLKNEELKCEQKLTTVRKDVYELYKVAKDSGKTIICISDMYLPSDFINTLLTKERIEVSKIFVSCECKAWKGNGTLYDNVKSYFNINESNIIHIGDNLNKDYIQPQKKGWIAYKINTTSDILRKYSNSIFNFNRKNFSEDPITRIIIGYFINNLIYSKNNVNINFNDNIVSNFGDFCKFCLSPFIITICLKIAFNPDIQNNLKYKKIFFVSRDGYLPQIVYNLIAKKFPVLESEYLYSGKKTYIWANYNDYCDFLKKSMVEFSNLSPQEFIRKFVYFDEVKHELLHLNENLDTFIKLNNNVLKKYFDNQKENSTRFYTNKFKNLENILVFDIGYSGSISIINQILNKTVDKIYVWQNKKNIEKDLIYKSTTYQLLNPGEYNCMYLYEELFSPLEGSCLGYTDSLKPILENNHYNKKMVDKYAELKNFIIEATDKFIDFFGDYTPLLYSNDTNAIVELLNFSIYKSSEQYPFLDSIIFSDLIGLANDSFLSTKIYKKSKNLNIFDRTMIKNRNYIVKPNNNWLNLLCDYGRFAIVISIEQIESIDFFIEFIEKNLFCTFFIVVSPEIHKQVKNYLYFNIDNKLHFILKNKESIFEEIILLNQNVLCDYDICLYVSDVKNNFSDFDFSLKDTIDKFINPSFLSLIINFIKDNDTSLLLYPLTESEKEFCSLKRIKLFEDECNTKINAFLKNFENEYVNFEVYDFIKIFHHCFWFKPKMLYKPFKYINDNLERRDFVDEVLETLIPVFINKFYKNKCKYIDF